MAKYVFSAVIAAMIAGTAMAANYETMTGDFQTIYTETPVQSYYAYPDDQNFIPETEFMERADSINYDNNIAAARAIQSQINPKSKNE